MVALARTEAHCRSLWLTASEGWWLHPRGVGCIRGVLAASEGVVAASESIREHERCTGGMQWGSVSQ